jgi:chorismate mutase
VNTPEPHETPLPETPLPEDVAGLRTEIDRLDEEILRLVKRRVAASKAVGRIRMSEGGTRIVVNREMAILDRYRELGPQGRQLAMALLELGRGRLGWS